jgi:peptide chain release factor subunit 1
VITSELVESVVGFNGAGLPVASIYATGDRAELPVRVRSLLHQIKPMTEDRSLEREARLSLREDIERIEDAARRPREVGGTVAMFACHGAGLFEEITLPRPVRDGIMVDAAPWVRPLLAILDEYHRTCVAMIDKTKVQLWELYAEEMREACEVKSRSLRKPDFGGFAGYAEYHVRNKADALMKVHFRKTASMIDQLFREAEYELLTVGGHQDEVSLFTNFLPKAIRPKLIGTFAADMATATPAEIKREAERILAEYDRERQRRQVDELIERHAMGGLAAIGIESCLWAGSLAGIQLLIVQEGEQVPGVICDESGWFAMNGDICPLCGEATRRTPDVLDELAAAVIEESGSVGHVEADTPLSKHTVAAALRFPLPPLPS